MSHVRKIRVYRTLEVSSAHSVLGEPLHGHNYKIVLGIEGPLGEDGLVLDFRLLRDILREATSQLDHRYLNEILENPTAERIGIYLWERIEDLLRERELLEKGMRIFKLEIWETSNSWVEIVSED